MSATLDATFGGPAVPNAVSVRDALFWKVTGTVVWDFFGDTATSDWSPVRGVWATASTPTAATFVIDGAFELPALDPHQLELQHQHLRAVGFELTWVREWRLPTGVRYQVLAGERPASGDASFAVFDEIAATPRAANFMFYSPRPIGSPSAGDFDYVRWFATH